MFNVICIPSNICNFSLYYRAVILETKNNVYSDSSSHPKNKQTNYLSIITKYPNAIGQLHLL